MASCVVDASAVLAWLFEETGSDVVERVLSDASLSAINLAEVLYRSSDEGMTTDTLERDLRSLGLSIQPFAAEDARLVEEIRRAARSRKLRLSLADYCCLALAVRLNLPVVSGDRAWQRLPLAIEVRVFR